MSALPRKISVPHKLMSPHSQLNSACGPLPLLGENKGGPGGVEYQKRNTVSNLSYLTTELPFPHI